KSRGLWQLGFYWLGLFTGPMIFTALLFSPWPPWGVWAAATAYGLMQTGVLLVNTAEDYPEDRQMGVRTVIVALGLMPGITLALALTLLGCAGLLASYAAMFVLRGANGWALSLLPLAGACAAVSAAIIRLRQQLHGKEEEAVAEVKRSARWVPVWITSLA